MAEFGYKLTFHTKANSLHHYEGILLVVSVGETVMLEPEFSTRFRRMSRLHREVTQLSRGQLHHSTTPMF